MPPRAAHLLFFVLLAQRWPTLLALNITWIRPAAGDVYGPGSPIIGQWQSNEGILAPSFGLCNGQGEAGDLGASDEDDGDCGTAIQPTVTHDEDDDSYQVALAAPQVLQPGDYILKITANAGTSISPVFSLSPSDTSNAPSSSSSAAQPNGAARSPATTALQAMPNLSQAHSPVSPAAYAIPLSIAGVIVIFAGVVCTVQRKKLLKERAETQEEFKRFQSMFHYTGGLLRRFTVRRFTLRRPRSDPQPPPVQRVPTIPESIAEEKDHELEADESDHYTRVYVPHLDRRPRPATKQPFHITATGRTTIPAHHFKTTLSPRVPYSPSLTPDAPRTYASQRRETSISGRNAAATGGVVDHYLQPSPYPVQLQAPPPAPMQRAHVRRQAPEVLSNLNSDHGRTEDLYEEVTRRLW